MNITTKFSTLKLLFFSFSSCLTIERSIVFKTMDRQCESFSRIFSSATGLDKSFIFIRNTRTSSSINENISNFQKFQKISKISKNFKIFIAFQNFHKISKFSKNFKILKFNFFFFKVQNFKIFTKLNKFKNFQKIQNFHKTCSRHVNLCWSLLSQKNQTLMNDWGNSIQMSMRQYSDL